MSDPGRTICCVRNAGKKNLQEEALNRLIKSGGEGRGSCPALHVAGDLRLASGAGELFERDLRSGRDSSCFVSFEIFG